jgi:DMSO/TMAO reductase YedYZ heme-binding membrane subunit
VNIGNYSISTLLAQHFWLIGMLAIVVMIILALSDEAQVLWWAGRMYQRWRGLLGVRWLQQALLQSLRTGAL